MFRVSITIFCFATLLAVAEWWLRGNLFDFVSYSNSESIDDQISQRDVEGDWTMLFVGDSETRWGIHPAEIDEAFEQQGINIKSFNHAFDGFGGSWWVELLPPLLEQPALQKVEVVVLGVQLTAGYGTIEKPSDNCGALQKPVLTSPLAIDLGVDSLCRNYDWDTRLGRQVFNGLWTVRYASSVRSLLLPSSVFAPQGLRFNSAKNGEPYRGFSPHSSIADNKEAYEGEFMRWKAQYNPERHFVPLPEDLWPNLTGKDGFFDRLNNVVVSSGRRLALFALPTNPVVIDTFNRRGDYHRNSKLLADWANNNGVTYIDLGIRDVEEPDIYFSDMRHLSDQGARSFSRILGNALASKYLPRSSGKSMADRGNDLGKLSSAKNSP
ncbi:hypothetical protein [Hahella ganghwensis]|uniref:hypothetical protein n=1 Tax=Hahella ganghwensis TaxID=286420 RepID=UPI0003999BB1|nr:hypothetical protein [Hahella ganghwensis]